VLTSARWTSGSERKSSARSISCGRTSRSYCDSVSCLRPRHFGLGRCGDISDPNGHLKKYRNLRRILQWQGRAISRCDGAAADRVRQPTRVLLATCSRMVSTFRPEHFSYVDGARRCTRRGANPGAGGPSTATARSAAPSSGWFSPLIATDLK
jgi:hypothetical protein